MHFLVGIHTAACLSHHRVRLQGGCHVGAVLCPPGHPQGLTHVDDTEYIPLLEAKGPENMASSSHGSVTPAHHARAWAVSPATGALPGGTRTGPPKGTEEEGGGPSPQHARGERAQGLGGPGAREREPSGARERGRCQWYSKSATAARHSDGKAGESDGASSAESHRRVAVSGSRRGPPVGRKPPRQPDADVSERVTGETVFQEERSEETGGGDRPRAERSTREPLPRSWGAGQRKGNTARRE